MQQQKAVEAEKPELEDLVDELQPGTKLLKGQYTITRFLNSGGFGITYLAKDSLDRDVVIKECFPAAFCRRSKSLVAARSRAHSAELRSVVQLFVKEARNLAKIVHPNIVAVHQVFEDNGTAYMAIDYVDGMDLQQIIDGFGPRPGPAEIVSITEKLLIAVGFVHEKDMLHRDISPDNILLDKSGEPVLIDFGAAREQASQKSRAMSALRVVKDGYSPQEFYIAGSEQGPWSDLYALGATLYHLISDEAPVNGQARLAALADEKPDPYKPLAGRFEGYPPGFLEAIDRALNTLPKQRVQSAKEWLLMFRRAPAAQPVARDETADAIHRMVTDFAQGTEAAPRATEPAPATAEDFGPPPGLPRKVSVQSPATPAPAHVGRSSVQVVAGVSAALAVILGAYFLFLGGDTPAAVAANDPAPAVAPASATAAAVAANASATDTPTAAAEPQSAETAPAAASAETQTAAAAPAESRVPAEPETQLPAEAAQVTAEEATAPQAELETAAVPVAAPDGVPLGNQIVFSVWDVQLPFDTNSRIAGNERVTVISRLEQGVDINIAGPWIVPGTRLYAVNGVPISGGDFATAVLNALHVDPDGRARVVVDYAAPGADRQTGLLTVTAVRLVSLANGTSFAISHMEDGWKTVVTKVERPSETDLLPGDVLLREQSSDLRLDQSNSLDAVLTGLVEKGETVADLSIIRDNKVASASMRLAVTR
ncbi:MAG: protein kinase domain-containing protein [Alphaproteobacteria bacterium]